jgi:hypothetical protein
MITGISVLGLLAGSMASFFRLDTSDAKAGSPETDGTAVETAPPDAGYDGLVRQIVDLQGQMARLTEQLEQYDPRRAE